MFQIQLLGPGLYIDRMSRPDYKRRFGRKLRRRSSPLAHASRIWRVSSAEGLIASVKDVDPLFTNMS